MLTDPRFLWLLAFFLVVEGLQLFLIWCGLKAANKDGVKYEICTTHKGKKTVIWRIL